MFPAGLNKFWQRISKSLYQVNKSTVEIKDGVNPQKLYLYNLLIDEANWERFSLAWSGNVLTLGTEKAGTGTVRPISISNASFLFSAVNTTFTAANGFSLAASSGALAIGQWGFSGYSITGSSAAGDTAVISGFNTIGASQTARALTLRGGNTGNDQAGFCSGGNLNLLGGNGASAATANAANGGSVVIAGGAGYGTGTKGIVTASRLRADGFATATAAKTADYTATLDDSTIEVDASGAARTITLFAASGNAGKIIVVKKTDSSANAVTVDGNASETIDGATTISLASQYSTAILQVNAAGTGWNKLAGV